jgi:hypothetical protein
MESTGINSVTRESTVWLLQSSFSRNSLLFDKFLWITPVLNLIQLRKTSRRIYELKDGQTQRQKDGFDLHISVYFLVTNNA